MFRLRTVRVANDQRGGHYVHAPAGVARRWLFCVDALVVAFVARAGRLQRSDRKHKHTQQMEETKQEKTGQLP